MYSSGFKVRNTENFLFKKMFMFEPRHTHVYTLLFVLNFYSN